MCHIAAMPGEEQFAAVGANKNDIIFTSCLECDGGVALRWNAKRRTFAVLPLRGIDLCGSRMTLSRHPVRRRGAYQRRKPKGR